MEITYARNFSYGKMKISRFVGGMWRVAKCSLRLLVEPQFWCKFHFFVRLVLFFFAVLVSDLKYRSSRDNSREFVKFCCMLLCLVEPGCIYLHRRYGWNILSTRPPPPPNSRSHTRYVNSTEEVLWGKEGYNTFHPPPQLTVSHP